MYKNERSFISSHFLNHSYLTYINILGGFPMDKETMSSYGLILITVLLMSILILLTQPIGERVYNVANKNINTIINSLIT